MKRICFSILVVGLCLIVTPAQAVRIAHNEAGQVVIVPLFNTLAGMDTLLKVSNGADYSALRVQLRNPEGQRIEAINVYLAPDQEWRAALTRRPEGPVMTAGDPKCVLSQEGDSTVESVQADIPISSDFGYIEILLMGHITDEQLKSNIAFRNCDLLADEFSNGEWNADKNAGVSAPTNSIRTIAQLIDVGKGTLYGLEPVHLAGFRNRPHHVPPGELFGLADAHDDGTMTGETSSLVCAQDCSFETWADPRDAVSSVLLAVAREAAYVVDPTIRASSSFIILNPMHPYYSSDEFSSHQTGFLLTDSDVGILPACLTPRPPIEFPLDRICPRPLEIQNPQALSGFTTTRDLSIDPDTAPLPIIGIPGFYPKASFLRGVELDSGSARIFFLSFDNPSLVSNDQSEYFGLPSIVLGFTEYQNGQLTSPDGGAVRANYGTSALGTKIASDPEDLK